MLKPLKKRGGADRSFSDRKVRIKKWVLDLRFTNAQNQKEVAMRLALLGCGRRLCASVLPTLAEISGLRVAALVDPSARARRRVASKLRPRGPRRAKQVLFLSEDEQLPPSSIDAVIVTSPHAFHERQARRWLQNGKPVFVEKPLACHPSHAAELVEMSREVGLTVSEPRRFRRDLAALRGIVHSGVIGRLQKVRYEDFIAQADDFHHNWRNDPWIAGGGVLLDLGCHTLGALLRTCMARNAELERVDLRRGPYRVETEARLHLSLEPGTEVEVQVGLIAQKAKGWEDLTLWGSAGKIRLFRVRSGESLSRIEVVAGGRREIVYAPAGNAFDSEGLRRFLQRPNQCDADDLGYHLKALDLIAQAYEEDRYTTRKRC